MSLFRSAFFRFMPLAAFGLALVAWLSFSEKAVSEETLDVGSVAPALDIEHWVQNGQGKFPKVTKFESGKVYVVEFWATWCGPCVQSMPHLAALQTKYADSGLQIISISNEPIEDVKKFLEKNIQDAEGQEASASEVTKAYCLTTDPDGSSDGSYMLAAKRDGIPCAFIVGKDSKIDWIGHPLEMEPILSAILEGKWNREEYIAEQKLIKEIQSTIGGLAREKKYSEAAAAIDGFLNRATDKRFQFGLLRSKIDLQLRAKSSDAELIKTYKTLFSVCETEPLFVQDVAWTAFENFSSGKMQIVEVLEISIAALGKVLPEVEGGDKANLFDTVARLNFAIGKLEPAIQAQKQAVELSDGSDEGGFKEFLDQLQSQPKDSPTKKTDAEKADAGKTAPTKK